MLLKAVEKTTGIVPLVKKLYRIYRRYGVAGLRHSITAFSLNQLPGAFSKGRGYSDAKGANFFSYISKVVSSEEDYVAISDTDFDFSRCSLKLVAFYLPQFHPIPENDAWWGKGFTEWTNVSKALPQFIGHYQPRLPGELGFYDLRLIDNQKRQIELAKKYGVYGFCYHYYWFSGRRLLDKPLRQVLEHRELDHPFCICWANENWTRTWDGLKEDVLITQAHSAGDDLAFIEQLRPFLEDGRYIRLNGRPLIIVYRVDVLHNARATADCWRNYCVRANLGDPYLVAAQTFDIEDPRPYGFDAALEFPPHKNAGAVVNSQLDIANPDYLGIVFDYRGLVEGAKKYEAPDYTLFRTVCPGWDNEPRRPGRGRTFINSTPERYEDWLTFACAQSLARKNEFVFVNAWNEWAEGAYLEPDRRYGYAYLAVTAQSLKKFCL